MDERGSWKVLWWLDFPVYASSEWERNNGWRSIRVLSQKANMSMAFRKADRIGPAIRKRFCNTNETNSTVANRVTQDRRFVDAL